MKSYQGLIALLPALIFGIPFLMLTDFFPFHRYGMFARIPTADTCGEVQIRIRQNGEWTSLTSGSPCLDRGLLKQSAAEAFGNPDRADLLIQKLRSSLPTFPDSIRLEKICPTSSCQKVLFP